MGLHPIVGRLLDMRDDGPSAAGAAVLTDRFWKTAFNRDPSVIGKTVTLGERSATIVGVLEPSVPYPAEDRDHRQRGDQPASSFRNHGSGTRASHDRTVRRLAPGADLKQRKSRTANSLRHDGKRTSRSLFPDSGWPHRSRALARPDYFARENRAPRASGGFRTHFHHCVLQCRQRLISLA